MDDSAPGPSSKTSPIPSKACYICQRSGGDLIQQPRATSIDSFMQSVRSRALYGHEQGIALQGRLGGATVDDLMRNQVRWHRDCYKEVTHKVHIERLKNRYEEALRVGIAPTHGTKGRPLGKEPFTSTPEGDPESSVCYTRSQSKSYDKKTCFFCNGTSEKGQLHQISTFNAGEQLRKVVDSSKNEQWKVNLSAALNPKDAHAIDIKYHLPCWVKYVQRSQQNIDTDVEGGSAVSNVSADIEFYYLINTLLKSGDILNIADVEEAYKDILAVNGAEDTGISRRTLKRKLVDNVSDIEFCRSPRAYEPDRMYSTKTKKTAIDDCDRNARNTNRDMNIVFDCAKIIRDDITAFHKQNPWKFAGSLSDQDHVPKSLESLIRWILVGPKSSLESTHRDQSVHRLARTISENIMFGYKSDRQVSYTPKQASSNFRHQNENPQVVGLGLKIHQATRSKAEVDMLHRFGYSISYQRVLRIETQLANAVLKQAAQNNGIYIPGQLVRGRFIFFAIDNVDFDEDTPDGKHTLHATATAVFQFRDASEPPPKAILDFQEATHERSLSSAMSPTSPQLLSCNVSSRQRPVSSTKYDGFAVEQNPDILRRHKAGELSWLLVRHYQRTLFPTSPTCSDNLEGDLVDLPSCTEEAMETNDRVDGDQAESARNKGHQDQYSDQSNTAYGIAAQQKPKAIHQIVPAWAGFNSLCSSSDTALTSVHALPLVASPAHEYQTLLTVIKQAEEINRFVVGPNKKVVVTLDMALYERAKRLQMLLHDCNEKWVLRIGEFHTVLCALRAIGAAVEGSGIDDAWVIADIYGPVTTRKILEGKHMRRSVDAHIMTLQVFFDLYIESFLKEQTGLQDLLEQPLKELADACKGGNPSEVSQKHRSLVESMIQHDLQHKLTQFEENHTDNPMFVVTLRYMDMVLTLLEFIRATREGNWALHLSSMDSLCKYFFAHNRLKYAQMVPLYLAEMYGIQESDPDIWREFNQGHFCVKKSTVPFCSIGVDHALEHVNRMMKVKGGLSGITQKPAALMRFFLIAPELTRLSDEFLHMAGISTSQRTKHHDLSQAKTERHERNIQKMKSVMVGCNPFQQDDQCLRNFVTNAVMPGPVQRDILRSVTVGQESYTTFVKERIVGPKNLWDKMNKVKLLTWTDASKTVKINLPTKEIELKQTRSLFARLLIIARTREELDLQDLIGRYEFSCVPMSIMAPDGSLLPCTDKSKLMTLLESIGTSETENSQEDMQSDLHLDRPQTTPSELRTESTSDPQSVTPGNNQQALIIDGMAVVHELSGLQIKTCLGIAQSFIKAIDSRVHNYTLVHIVFDRYDVEKSLKTRTRRRRQGKQGACCKYDVTDKTQFNMPLNRFLSNSENKDQLTTYLAGKVLNFYRDSTKSVIVASKGSVASNSIQTELGHLESNQEEADTLLILHAISASKLSSSVHIMSPDTDVFVLALQKLHLMGNNVSMLVGTGNKRRTVKLQPIRQALDENVASGLIGFHAFTGSDTTGRIAGKGKLTCWKLFNSGNRNILKAFSELGQTLVPSTAVFQGLEEFVCLLFAPRANIKDLGQLRWYMFKKNKAEAEKLPPTKSALTEHILRCHYQAMVWLQADIQNPSLPPPTSYGWYEKNDEYMPKVSDLPPAPKAVIELVKCGCGKSRCSTEACSCRKNALVCTELCACDADAENCTNVPKKTTPDDTDDELESDDDTELLI